MSLSLNVAQLPQFSIEGYATWSFRAESYLCSFHDRVWEVITDGPITVMKVITMNDPTTEQPKEDEAAKETTREIYVEKPKDEFTLTDFRLVNLDRVAHNIMQTTISDSYLACI